MFQSASYGVDGEFSAASIPENADLNDAIDFICEFSGNLDSNVIVGLVGVSVLHWFTQLEAATDRIQSFILYGNTRGNNGNR